MKSIFVITSTYLLAIFTHSVFSQTNNDEITEPAASLESGTSSGGVGDGNSGNDNYGDGGNGDDDDGDYRGYQPNDSNTIKLRINDKEEPISIYTIGLLAMHEWLEPPPMDIRKAEIISGPPGIHCVFWAPQSEGDGESFISPVLRLPSTPEEAEADRQSGRTLNKFDLHPEVPAFPAHIVTHFQVRQPDRKVVVLLEVRYGNVGEDHADILYVDLDEFKPNGKRFGSVNLDGEEGKYSPYGYDPKPTILRARVLAAPDLTRTKCILGKRENLTAKYFTSEGETPQGPIESAEMLLCTEESDEEEG